MQSGAVQKLHFGKLQEADHVRRVMRADIPAGTSLEEVLQPTFLAHHTAALKPGDILEAVCEDGAWMAWLWVLFVSTVEVKMDIIWSKEFTAEEAAVESETHVIKWISPVNKYAVVRKDTGAIIKDRLYPKSEAYTYLKNHLQGLSGG